MSSIKSSGKGHIRSCHVSDGLDSQIELARTRLGWSRSYFYKYALTKLLQELTVLKEVAHEQAAVSPT